MPPGTRREIPAYTPLRVFIQGAGGLPDSLRRFDVNGDGILDIRDSNLGWPWWSGRKWAPQNLPDSLIRFDVNRDGILDIRDSNLGWPWWSGRKKWR